MKAPDNDVNKLSEEIRQEIVKAAEDYCKRTLYPQLASPTVKSNLWGKLTDFYNGALFGFTAASNKTAAGIDWHTGVEKNALGYCAWFKVDNQTFLLIPYDTLEEAQEYQLLLFKALQRFGSDTSMKSFALWLAENHWAIKNRNKELYEGSHLQVKTLDELLEQFLKEYPAPEFSISSPASGKWTEEDMRKCFEAARKQIDSGAEDMPYYHDEFNSFDDYLQSLPSAGERKTVSE